VPFTTLALRGCSAARRSKARSKSRKSTHWLAVAIPKSAKNFQTPAKLPKDRPKMSATEIGSGFAFIYPTYQDRKSSKNSAVQTVLGTVSAPKAHSSGPIFTNFRGPQALNDNLPTSPIFPRPEPLAVFILLYHYILWLDMA
jgi:hypothetical protein